MPQEKINRTLVGPILQHRPANQGMFRFPVRRHGLHEAQPRYGVAAVVARWVELVGSQCLSGFSMTPQCSHASRSCRLLMLVASITSDLRKVVFIVCLFLFSARRRDAHQRIARHIQRLRQAYKRAQPNLAAVFAREIPGTDKRASLDSSACDSKRYMRHARKWGTTTPSENLGS